MTTKNYSRPMRTQANETRSARSATNDSASRTYAQPAETEMNLSMRDPDLVLSCQGADPELFFPTSSEALEQALDLCSTCPAQTQCLSFAMANRERGVWGGQLLKNGKPTDELFRVELGPLRERSHQIA